MTVEWFDLAQRLAAVRTGRVIPRLMHSPVPAQARRHPVAVRAALTGDTITLTACGRGSQPVTVTGRDGLRLLDDLGVSIGNSEWATLVIDSHATLPALVALGRRCATDGPHSDVAAHVGWWSDREDFPGTSAVVNVVEACQTRWVTGDAPAVERTVEHWHQWLRTTGTGIAGLLDLLDRVSDGIPLAGLEAVTRDDAYAWQRAAGEHADGWDWRTPDPISRAATGLRARCDTADLWTAALLADPLYRRRAVHTGHVVTGAVHVPSHARNKATIVCDRTDARLRSGSTIVGWAGDAIQDGPRFTATVESTGMRENRLALHLASITTATLPPSGAHVSLMDAPPNEHASRDGRRRFRALYGTRSSWLTTGRTPTPQRREVPLDVLIAGADDS